MSAIDTLRDALYGNPPVEGFKPSRSGVLKAFTDLFNVAGLSKVGFAAYPTVAAMNAVTSMDDGSLAYVYYNNNSTSDAANKIYQFNKANLTWVVATWYAQLLTQVVQPLVDAASASADRAETAANSFDGYAGPDVAGGIRDLLPSFTHAGYYAASNGAFVADVNWSSTNKLRVAKGDIICLSGVSVAAAAAFVAYNGSAVVATVAAAPTTMVISQFYVVPDNVNYVAMSVANPANYPSYPNWQTRDGLKAVERSVWIIRAGVPIGDISRYAVLYGYIDSAGAYQMGGSANNENVSYWRRSPPLPMVGGYEMSLSAYTANGAALLTYRASNGSIAGQLLSAVPSPDGAQSAISTRPDAATAIEICSANQSNYPSAVAAAFGTNFTIRPTRAIANLYPVVKPTDIVVLYGDSRMSTDYDINRKAWADYTGCTVLNNGLSGHTVLQNASDSDLTAIFNVAPDPLIVVWLPGGNDNGAAGTVGRLTDNSPNTGETKNAQLAVGTATPAAGSSFIQCIDLAIRKFQARYADARTRAGVASGDSQALVQAKLLAVVQPRLIVLTDLPQIRADTSFNDAANWERKRQAIIEACNLNKVEHLDTMGLLQVHFNGSGFAPPTDKVNVNGDDYYDNLHPFLLHYRIARLAVGRFGLR